MIKVIPDHSVCVYLSLWHQASHYFLNSVYLSLWHQASHYFLYSVFVFICPCDTRQALLFPFFSVCRYLSPWHQVSPVISFSQCLSLFVPVTPGKPCYFTSFVGSVSADQSRLPQHHQEGHRTSNGRVWDCQPDNVRTQTSLCKSLRGQPVLYLQALYTLHNSVRFLHCEDFIGNSCAWMSLSTNIQLRQAVCLSVVKPSVQLVSVHCGVSSLWCQFTVVSVHCGVSSLWVQGWWQKQCNLQAFATQQNRSLTPTLWTLRNLDNSVWRSSDRAGCTCLHCEDCIKTTGLEWTGQHASDRDGL